MANKPPAPPQGPADKKPSMRLKDTWDGQGSAFQDEDGKYDWKGQAQEHRESGSISPSELAQLKREQKVQALGKQIVSTLFMLVRNVKIHAPDNAIFLKPIEAIKESMNTVVAFDRHLDLHAVGTSIYLNNLQLKFDFGMLESVQYLTKEFESRDIGGFSTNRSVTSQEIRDFLYVFTAEMSSVGEEGLDGHKLNAMRLARFAVVKELLDKMDAEPDLNEQVDRKKYLMTVYARCIFFIRYYFEKFRGGEPVIPFAKAGRLVQDLVELSVDQKTHFLGATTARSDSEYLVYHSVNVSLLSIVFGCELGLDRRQLHDLGMAALFSQIGLVELPDELLQRPGGLTTSERAEVDLNPLRSAKAILRARGLDKTTMQRIVATYEARVDYAIPRKNEQGDVELVTPKLGLGIYGKVIAICDNYDALTSKRPFRDAYGPEIALALMSSELKYKFDPILLRVFMKVMAIQPIKIMGQSDSRMRLG